jgi:predicted GH43/DUF377 family glycosyl hydrolase
MVAAMLVAACTGLSAGEAPEERAYLFSYFIGNGEDGLHLATSRDGLKWDALKGGQSFLKPEVGGKLMRDPCITQGPDGTFHMVWTTGWWEKGIGLAHSKDLVTWSKQEWIPVMQDEPTAKNSWAPEIAYHPDSKQFIIFWATTIPGRFPATEAKGDDNNHRMYFTTTADFKTFSKTALFYDPGFNCIDATIAPADGRWVMFIKDETKVPVAKKNIRLAWADKATGPWGPAGPAISGDWVEGPSALKIGQTWFLYFDAYTRHRYEGLQSDDLKTWKPFEPSFPKGVRHGTAFAVPVALLEKLK